MQRFSGGSAGGGGRDGRPDPHGSYPRRAAQVVPYRLRCDKEPLSGSLGPPDFYPPSPDDPEESLTREHVQGGYKDSAEGIEEAKDTSYSMADCHHLWTKASIACHKEAVRVRLRALNNAVTRKRKVGQVYGVPLTGPLLAKPGLFPEQKPFSEEFRRRWMEDLAGRKRLRTLAEHVPHGFRKRTLFDALVRHNVPLLRATWYIKIMCLNQVRPSAVGSSADRTQAKRTELWTNDILEFGKLAFDELCQLSDGGGGTPAGLGTHGQASPGGALGSPPPGGAGEGSSGPCAPAEGAPGGAEGGAVDVHAKWQYFVRLVMWHHQEGLVLRTALVDWLLKQLQERDSQGAMEALLPLLQDLAPLISFSQAHTRALADTCLSKLRLLCPSGLLPPSSASQPLARGPAALAPLLPLLPLPHTGGAPAELRLKLGRCMVELLRFLLTKTPETFVAFDCFPLPHCVVPLGPPGGGSGVQPPPAAERTVRSAPSGSQAAPKKKPGVPSPASRSPKMAAAVRASVPPGLTGSKSPGLPGGRSPGPGGATGRGVLAACGVAKPTPCPEFSLEAGGADSVKRLDKDGGRAGSAAQRSSGVIQKGNPASGGGRALGAPGELQTMTTTTTTTTRQKKKDPAAAAEGGRLSPLQLAVCRTVEHIQQRAQKLAADVSPGILTSNEGKVVQLLDVALARGDVAGACRAVFDPAFCSASRATAASALPPGSGGGSSAWGQWGLPGGEDNDALGTTTPEFAAVHFLCEWAVCGLRSGEGEEGERGARDAIESSSLSLNAAGVSRNGGSGSDRGERQEGGRGKRDLQRVHSPPSLDHSGRDRGGTGAIGGYGGGKSTRGVEAESRTSGRYDLPSPPLPPPPPPLLPSLPRVCQLARVHMAVSVLNHKLGAGGSRRGEASMVAAAAAAPAPAPAPTPAPPLTPAGSTCGPGSSSGSGFDSDALYLLLLTWLDCHTPVGRSSSVSRSALQVFLAELVRGGLFDPHRYVRQLIAEGILQSHQTPALHARAVKHRTYLRHLSPVLLISRSTAAKSLTASAPSLGSGAKAAARQSLGGGATTWQYENERRLALYGPPCKRRKTSTESQARVPLPGGASLELPPVGLSGGASPGGRTLATSQAAPVTDGRPSAELEGDLGHEPMVGVVPATGVAQPAGPSSEPLPATHSVDGMHRIGDGVNASLHREAGSRVPEGPVELRGPSGEDCTMEGADGGRAPLRAGKRRRTGRHAEGLERLQGSLRAALHVPEPEPELASPSLSAHPAPAAAGGLSCRLEGMHQSCELCHRKQQEGLPDVSQRLPGGTSAATAAAQARGAGGMKVEEAEDEDDMWWLRSKRRSVGTGDGKGAAAAGSGPASGGAVEGEVDCTRGMAGGEGKGGKAKEPTPGSQACTCGARAASSSTQTQPPPVIGLRPHSSGDLLDWACDAADDVAAAMSTLRFQEQQELARWLDATVRKLVADGLAPAGSLPAGIAAEVARGGLPPAGNALGPPGAVGASEGAGTPGSGAGAGSGSSAPASARGPAPGPAATRTPVATKTRSRAARSPQVGGKPGGGGGGGGASKLGDPDRAGAGAGRLEGDAGTGGMARAGAGARAESGPPVSELRLEPSAGAAVSAAAGSCSGPHVPGKGDPREVPFFGGGDGGGGGSSGKRAWVLRADQLALVVFALDQARDHRALVELLLWLLSVSGRAHAPPPLSSAPPRLPDCAAGHCCGAGARAVLTHLRRYEGEMLAMDLVPQALSAAMAAAATAAAADGAFARKPSPGSHSSASSVHLRYAKHLLARHRLLPSVQKWEQDLRAAGSAGDRRLVAELDSVKAGEVEALFGGLGGGAAAGLGADAALGFKGNAYVGTQRGEVPPGEGQGLAGQSRANGSFGDVGRAMRDVVQRCMGGTVSALLVAPPAASWIASRSASLAASRAAGQVPGVSLERLMKEDAGGGSLLRQGVEQGPPLAGDAVTLREGNRCGNAEVAAASAADRWHDMYHSCQESAAALLAACEASVPGGNAGGPGSNRKSDGGTVSVAAAAAAASALVGAAVASTAKNLAAVRLREEGGGLGLRSRRNTHARGVACRDGEEGGGGGRLGASQVRACKVEEAEDGSGCRGNGAAALERGRDEDREAGVGVGGGIDVGAGAGAGVGVGVGVGDTRPGEAAEGEGERLGGKEEVGDDDEHRRSVARARSLVLLHVHCLQLLKESLAEPQARVLQVAVVEAAAELVRGSLCAAPSPANRRPPRAPFRMSPETPESAPAHVVETAGGDSCSQPEPGTSSDRQVEAPAAAAAAVLVRAVVSGVVDLETAVKHLKLREGMARLHTYLQGFAAQASGEAGADAGACLGTGSESGGAAVGPAPSFGMPEDGWEAHLFWHQVLLGECSGLGRGVVADLVGPADLLALARLTPCCSLEAVFTPAYSLFCCSLLFVAPRGHPLSLRDAEARAHAQAQGQGQGQGQLTRAEEPALASASAGDGGAGAGTGAEAGALPGPPAATWRALRAGVTGTARRAVRHAPVRDLLLADSKLLYTLLTAAAAAACKSEVPPRLRSTATAAPPHPPPAPPPPAAAAAAEGKGQAQAQAAVPSAARLFLEGHLKGRLPPPRAFLQKGGGGGQPHAAAAAGAGADASSSAGHMEQLVHVLDTLQPATFHWQWLYMRLVLNEQIIQERLQSGATLVQAVAASLSPAEGRQLWECEKNFTSAVLTRLMVRHLAASLYSEAVHCLGRALEESLILQVKWVLEGTPLLLGQRSLRQHLKNYALSYNFTLTPPSAPAQLSSWRAARPAYAVLLWGEAGVGQEEEEDDEDDEGVRELKLLGKLEQEVEKADCRLKEAEDQEEGEVVLEEEEEEATADLMEMEQQAGKTAARATTMAHPQLGTPAGGEASRFGIRAEAEAGTRAGAGAGVAAAAAAAVRPPLLRQVWCGVGGGGSDGGGGEHAETQTHQGPSLPSSPAPAPPRPPAFAVERALAELVLPCLARCSDETRSSFAYELVRQLSNIEQHVSALSRPGGFASAAHTPGSGGGAGGAAGGEIVGGAARGMALTARKKGLGLSGEGTGVNSLALSGRRTAAGPAESMPASSAAALQTSIWLRLQFLLPLLPIIHSDRDQSARNMRHTLAPVLLRLLTSHIVQEPVKPALHLPPPVLASHCPGCQGASQGGAASPAPSAEASSRNEAAGAAAAAAAWAGESLFERLLAVLHALLGATWASWLKPRPGSAAQGKPLRDVPLFDRDIVERMQAYLEHARLESLLHDRIQAALPCLPPQPTVSISAAPPTVPPAAMAAMQARPAASSLRQKGSLASSASISAPPPAGPQSKLQLTPSLSGSGLSSPQRSLPQNNLDVELEVDPWSLIEEGIGTSSSSMGGSGPVGNEGAGQKACPWLKGAIRVQRTHLMYGNNAEDMF